MSLFKKETDKEVEYDSRRVPDAPLPEKIKAYFSSRKFKHGGLSTILIVFFLIAMIVLNIVVSMLVDRAPQLSPDLSQNQLYSLGEQSMDVLNAIPDDYDIVIEIFANELACENPSSSLDPYSTISQANDLIKRYQQNSDKVTIVYTDLVKTPGSNSKYGTKYADIIRDYYIAIASYKNEELVHVQLTSFYDMLPHLVDETYDTTGAYVVNSLVETTMTSKIKTVCQTIIPKVAFLTGNSNRSFGNLQSSLDTNGFDVIGTEYNLLTDEIPDDIDIAVLASPMKDLSIDEINKLDEFLANDDNLGKSLVYFANSAMPDTPTLNSLLIDWDIEQTNNVVYESDSSWRSSSRANILYNANYSYDAFTKDLADRNVYVAMDRPVQFEAVSGGNASTVLSTTIGGVAFPKNIVADLTSVTDADKSEKVTSIMSTRSMANSDGETVSSNVVAIGSDSIYQSDFLGSDAYANQEFLLNIFSELAGFKDEQVYIQPKSLISKDFDVSASTALTVTIVFQYALPIILVVLGVFVFLRRRYL